METLLRNEFTWHYGLPNTFFNKNFSATTKAAYFELNDDDNLIYTSVNQGVAKYINSNNLEITVINFEYFFNTLPHAFIQGKEKCDLIVNDYNEQYFLLNELTDTHSNYVLPYTNNLGQQPGKRQKAISQLLSSLTLLMNVPVIANYAMKHKIRHCCFFNKQRSSPKNLTVITAFNRLNTLTTHGLQMENVYIESFGFEFWEYSGGQEYNL